MTKGAESWAPFLPLDWFVQIHFSRTTPNLAEPFFTRITEGASCARIVRARSGGWRVTDARTRHNSACPT